MYVYLANRLKSGSDMKVGVVIDAITYKNFETSIKRALQNAFLDNQYIITTPSQLFDTSSSQSKAFFEYSGNLIDTQKRNMNVSYPAITQMKTSYIYFVNKRTIDTVRTNVQNFGITETIPYLSCGVFLDPKYTTAPEAYVSIIGDQIAYPGEFYDLDLAKYLGNFSKSDYFSLWSDELVEAYNKLKTNCLVSKGNGKSNDTYTEKYGTWTADYKWTQVNEIYLQNLDQATVRSFLSPVVKGGQYLGAVVFTILISGQYNIQTSIRYLMNLQVGALMTPVPNPDVQNLMSKIESENPGLITIYYDRLKQFATPLKGPFIGVDYRATGQTAVAELKKSLNDDITTYVSVMFFDFFNGQDPATNDFYQGMANTMGQILPSIPLRLISKKNSEIYLDEGNTPEQNLSALRQLTDITNGVSGLVNINPYYNHIFFKVLEDIEPNERELVPFVAVMTSDTDRDYLRRGIINVGIVYQLYTQTFLSTIFIEMMKNHQRIDVDSILTGPVFLQKEDYNKYPTYFQE